ncbi:hypothetical protein Tco_1302229 [Tanacetum coccineum]
MLLSINLLLLGKVNAARHNLLLLVATIKVKTINEEQQLQALVDGKKIVVTKASVRRDLQLDDEEGTDCLPNAIIFEQLTLIGQGKDFSGRETPLFLTMVVQAQEEIGEGLAMPTDPHHTPIITQPSLSQPQRKQKSRRSKKKDTKSAKPGEHKDCLSSGDYKFKEESQEVREERKDASKQGRKIHDIDADEDITLENVHDAEMFDVNDLDGDEMVVESEVVAKKKDDEVNVVEKVVSAAEEIVNAATITEDEITLAQALAELKSVKPKVTTATTATTKGILLQDPSESITTTTTIPSKDKGKGIMVEEPLQMKKKDQISFDEQKAIRLQVKFDQEVRLAREKDEANIALTKEWNDIQAKIETDDELA